MPQSLDMLFSFLSVTCKFWSFHIAGKKTWKSMKVIRIPTGASKSVFNIFQSVRTVGGLGRWNR